MSRSINDEKDGKVPTTQEKILAIMRKENTPKNVTELGLVLLGAGIPLVIFNPYPFSVIVGWGAGILGAFLAVFGIVDWATRSHPWVREFIKQALEDLYFGESRRKKRS